MNANELADELEGWSDNWLSDKHEENVFAKHAAMLRSQAKQIAELEKRIEEVKETNGQFANLIQMYREEMEKLRQLQAENEALKQRPVINKEDGLVCAKCYERIGQ